MPPLTIIVLRSAGIMPERIRSILLEDGVRSEVRAARLADAVQGAPAVDIVVYGDHDTSLSLTFLGEQNRQIFPEAAMLAIAWRPDEANPRGALAAGVDGIVMGADIDRTLTPAVLAVNAGMVSVPRLMWHNSGAGSLSARQQETLTLALAGLTNGEIARRLGLSPATVTTHLKSAFRRLAVHSRGEAAEALFGMPPHTAGLQRRRRRRQAA
jgi:DNA-binding NarL/FixJ family response regulator